MRFFNLNLYDEIKNNTKDEEMDEIIKFGMQYLLETFKGSVCTILLSLPFLRWNLFYAFVLWLSTFFLRTHAGGYHAKTKKMCFLLSIVSIIVVNSIVYLLINDRILNSIIVVLLVLIVFIFAPVDVENKRLEPSSKSRLKHKIRIIMTLELVMFIISYYVIEKPGIAQAVEVGFVIVSVSLLVERYKQKLQAHKIVSE